MLMGGILRSERVREGEEEEGGDAGQAERRDKVAK